MSTIAENPIEIVSRFGKQKNNQDFARLVTWALWSIDSLRYLEEIDHSQGDYPLRDDAHHPDVVDIAHARWATGTAITAVDLCAAALGQMYCGNSSWREYDLRSFDGARNSRRVASSRSALPRPMLTWVDAVQGDTKYKDIQGARNRFTHAWLNRGLTRGGPSGHRSRTEFKVTETNRTLTSRDLVVESRDFACKHVDDFIGVIASMP